MFAACWNLRSFAPLGSAIVILWPAVGAAQFVQPKTTQTAAVSQSADASTGQMAEALWRQFGLKLASSPAGNVLVEDVAPASLCARAGIEKGDEIAKVNDAAASGPESVARPMLSLAGTAKVALTLQRADRAFEASVALNPANSSPAGPANANAPVPSAPEGNVFGMSVHQDASGPVVIDRVSSLSPADKAGIRAGDILINVGGSPAAPVEQMISAVTDLMARRQHGSGIPIEIARNDGHNKLQAMTIQLLPADATGVADNKQSSAAASSSSVDGIEAGILGLALRFVSPNTVSVTRVAPGSPAAAAGIVPGDVITMVDQAPVATPEQFVNIVGIHQMGEEINMVVMRQNKPFPTSMRLTPRVQDVAEATRVAAEAVTSQSFKTLESRIQELSATVQALQGQVEQMAKQK